MFSNEAPQRALKQPVVAATPVRLRENYGADFLRLALNSSIGFAVTV
jgi:hypothetical protein